VIKYVAGAALPWKVRLRDGRDEVHSFRTKKDAEAFVGAELDRRARERAGLPDPKPHLRFRELVNLYLEQYTARSKPWFEQIVSHSNRAFGHVYVRDLAPERISRWLHQDLTQSPATKRHIITAMSQVLNAGVEWGYLERNPARGRAVRRPAKEPVRAVNPFASWGEVLAVAAAIGRYDPLVRFACATGLRIGEWRELRWGDVDREGRELHVARTVNRQGLVVDEGKTPAATRTVSLSRHALDALGDLPKPLRTTQLLFPGPAGGHLDVPKWRTRSWKKALESAELEDRPPYQMRHTYATLALTEGVALEWLSAQLGHRDIQTTRNHYARFLPRYNARMLAILDQIGAESGPHQDASHLQQH
jgi:integrase